MSQLQRMPALSEQHNMSGGWVAVQTAHGMIYWCNPDGRTTSARRPHRLEKVLRTPVDGEDCCPPWELWTRFCVQGELHERCFWFNPETETTATFQTFEPWPCSYVILWHHNSCDYSFAVAIYTYIYIITASVIGRAAPFETLELGLAFAFIWFKSRYVRP